MTKVTLVTHSGAPNGVEDDLILAAVLRRRGAAVRLAAWDDPDVDWSKSSVSVIRSTWNYHLDPAVWFAWLEAVSSCTQLINSVQSVRWNSEKTYLLELAANTIPIVPTVLLDRSSDVVALCSGRGWHDVVIKPTIGASAHGARRFQGAAIQSLGASHAADLTKNGDALLQPYQPAVDTEFERSLVFVDGSFCHAFRKPSFYSGLSDAGLSLYAATPRELALGQQVLSALPTQPVFARVDLVPTHHGPVVMEVELVEPQLALRLCPETSERLASTILSLNYDSNEASSHDAKEVTAFLSMHQNPPAP